MPRSEARIQTSIWLDPDFLALPGDAQRLYMFLLSQDNLSHAGALPLTVNRWATSAADLTAESIRSTLDVLSSASFVVVDEATEELLVRTFLKGDKVYRQPQVMAAVKPAASLIRSLELRKTLFLEVRKLLDLPDLTDRAKAQVTSLLEALPAPSPEALPQAATEPLGERGSLRKSVVDTPYPSPLSIAVPAEKTKSRKPRDPDPIWDAVMAACGISSAEVTESSRGNFNRAVSDLKRVKATPDEIGRRAVTYQRKFRTATLTPMALARHWAECVPPPPNGDQAFWDQR